MDVAVERARCERHDEPGAHDLCDEWPRVVGELGERTVAAVRGAFEFGEPRTAEAKGKAGGVACRPLVRALSLMRTRGVGGLARAFLGRDEQLGLLQTAYRRAVDGSHPVLVTILGDAGVNVDDMDVGKTAEGQAALMALSVTTPVPDAVVETLRKQDGVVDARAIELG